MSETEIRKVVTGAIDRAFAAVAAKRTRTAVPTPAGAITDTRARAEHLAKAHQANPAAVGAALVEDARQRTQAVEAMADVRRTKLLTPGASLVRKNEPSTEERAAAAGDPAWSERLHERVALDAVKHAPRMRIG